MINLIWVRWAQMQDDSFAVRFDATTRLRHLLSSSKRANSVMSALGSARLKQLVLWLESSDDHPKLQHEYLWACAHCTASKNTDLIVEQGAIPVFLRLLRSPHTHIRERARCACTSANDYRVEFRDELLALDALSLVLDFARNPLSSRIGALQHAAWFCATRSPQPVRASDHRGDA